MIVLTFMTILPTNIFKMFDFIFPFSVVPAN